jgi:DNA repair ATPase RecN
MRLYRLQITSFAAIESIEVEFGPGLNVLYGPNDLGKSTVSVSVCSCLTYRPTANGMSGGPAPETLLLR